MPMWVYAITRIEGGQKYIGITNSIKRRWNGHIRDASSGRSLTVIGRALRKYGPEAFIFEVLREASSRAEASSLERELIATHQTLTPLGYNITEGGDRAATRKGAITPPETKAKMSAAAKGKRKSPEHVAAMIAARKGVHISPEHHAAMMRGLLGKRFKRTIKQTVAGRISRRLEALAKGACWVEHCNGNSGVWRARISLDGKTIHIGLFETEEAARAAYIRRSEEHLAYLRDLYDQMEN